MGSRTATPSVDKEAAQARYTSLIGQTKQGQGQQGQGLDFAALEKPPEQASKKGGSLLTNNMQSTLFAR